MLVKKADGSLQLFNKEKIVRTCLRMGANKQVAYEVAEKVERRMYDGMSTAKILQMIFQFMRRHRPGVRSLFDLRKGLSLMVSKPEFEVFVQVLLAHNGFEVTPNQLLDGRCVKHEVDAIARKNGVTFFVEAKHHANYHTPTGLDESRIARAVLEDVIEGYALGKGNLKIDRAMIVTNTRYSDHAIQYGKCRGILQIGWGSPTGLGLQDMIEGNNLLPLSCLRDLNIDARAKLANSGIVLFEQVIEEDTAGLARKTGLSQEFIKNIKEKIET
jgi:predicted nucleic acid-binding protein